MVTFSPNNTNTFNGNINLNYDGAGWGWGWGGQNLVENLTGTGVSALVFSDPSPFDFGNVPVGGSANHTFTVTNMGSTNATQMSAGPLGGHFSYNGGGQYPGVGGTCGTSLTPGASCTIVVTFTANNPTLSAEASTLITITGPEEDRPLST